MIDLIVGPFAEFAFMRRALVATVALSMSAAPLGVFLSLRRMSLLGDALSHAVLPGVAIGFMLAGLSLGAMAAGGVVAGLLVAALAGMISRATPLKEDASLAALYLMALALGVTLISRQGSQLDLLHILFGSALGVDEAGLLLVASVASISLLALAAMYRGLVLETFDPIYLSATGHRGWVWQQGFLMLVVINLVAGFQTLGTLMAVGLMMLPGSLCPALARPTGCPVGQRQRPSHARQRRRVAAVLPPRYAQRTDHHRLCRPVLSAVAAGVTDGLVTTTSQTSTPGGVGVPKSNRPRLWRNDGQVTPCARLTPYRSSKLTVTAALLGRDWQLSTKPWSVSQASRPKFLSMVTPPVMTLQRQVAQTPPLHEKGRSRPAAMATSSTC